MAGTGEVAWTFDQYMEEGARRAGYPVITPEGPIIGGVSHIGPEYPDITVDPALGGGVYSNLLDTLEWRLRGRPGLDRAGFAHAVSDTAAEAVDTDPDRYQDFLAHTATDGVVDLGQLLGAGVGDERTRALAAGFLVARLMPQSGVRFDANQVDGVDRFWVRFRAPADYTGYLSPVSTVVLHPGQRRPATLWETGTYDGRWRNEYQTGSSPYVRPDDQANLALLTFNSNNFPVARAIAKDLRELDNDRGLESLGWFEAIRDGLRAVTRDLQ